MRIYLLLGLLLAGSLQAQNSAAYTDAQIKEYIEISNSFIAFKAQQANYAQRMQSELGISDADMEESLARLRALGSWEALRSELEPDFAVRFDSLMTYRATLKDRLKTFLLDELEAHNWTEDQFEHFKLTLQSDPKLQERMLKISKTLKP
jgi:hypothetical protein